MRALNFLDVGCFPVVSALTVQNSGRFAALEAVSAELMERQIDAALDEKTPGSVKVGLLANAEQIEMLARKLGNFLLVVDPVMRSSTGFDIVDDDMLAAYKNTLFPKATLVTPNAYEASELAGSDVTDIESAKRACLAIAELGSRAVLVKGGHFDSEKGTDVLYLDGDFHLLAGAEQETELRGTGCTYSSLIAGYMATGHELLQSAEQAKTHMNSFLEPQDGGTLSQAQMEVWLAVHSAAASLISILPPDFIAEVGNNIAFALEGASTPDDVCSLDSRLVVKSGKVVTLGTPVFGRDSHVGRVVLAAMRHYPDLRCALNLRYSENTLSIIKQINLNTGRFDRLSESHSKSSMEWGTDTALQNSGRLDIIYDTGSVGKEPMIRLLATDPGAAIGMLRRILERKE